MLGERKERGGSELSHVVTSICREEDEGVGGRAREGAEVVWRVARSIEDVETSVVEIVNGAKPADGQMVLTGKVDFMDRAPFEGALEEEALWVDWVAGHAGRLKSWTDDEVDGRGEEGWVTDVVKVGV